MTADTPTGILGLVLAGGRSQRFGRDKSLALLDGATLIEHVCRRASAQVEALVVSGGVGSCLNIQTVSDEIPGQGPLSGVLAGLTNAAQRGHERLATFACDGPFFPDDLVKRLGDALRKTRADISVARHGDDIHPTFALYDVRCRVALSDAFSRGLRSLRGIGDCLAVSFVDFPHTGFAPGGDPFFNVNTPADLAAAEAWLARRKS